MSFDADTLFRLLPAIHRIRDAELAGANVISADEANELTALEALASPTVAEKNRRSLLQQKAALSALLRQEAIDLAALEALASPTVAQQAQIAALKDKAARGPLKTLLMVFADELAGMEENLAQLYDDQFIETCAEWAISYIGDLIGYENLNTLNQTRGFARAEVAHTIALRRRKGTAAVLEQLARDVTGWNARAVEYFQFLGDTQYMNHLRPKCLYAPDMRRWEPLARIGTAFESVSHTVDVRRIESRRGWFNIPNVGIFLWRLDARRHKQSPAVKVDDRRYLFSPLGAPLQLYTRPVAEDEIAHLADPINVPDPIARRTLDAHRAFYYGTRESPAHEVDNTEPSLVLFADGSEVPRQAIVACNLSDDGGGWAHVPPNGAYGIDPVLGRIALAPDVAVPASFTVTYHDAFSADMGGGEYAREREPDASGTTILRVPADHASIGAALAALGGNGVVEITDNGRYEETLSVAVAAGGQITIRTADCRPAVVLGGELQITGGDGASFTLDGLLVAGNGLRVPASPGNTLAKLNIVHATLVPGRTLDAQGNPVSPAEPSLQVDLPGVAVVIDHAISGSLRVVGGADGATVSANDSILDASASDGTVYCAPTLDAPGGALSLDACTVIGKIRASSMGLVSNSLLLAAAAAGDTLLPIYIERLQTGCVRFTYLPFASRVPRRHRCQPESAQGESDVTPRFTSLRFGVAAYCQLSRSTPDEIRRGGDDESEMGAFHSLFPAQRESNLQVRLREFLRVGLSAGIFYET